MSQNKSVEEVVEAIDLVGAYAEKAMFLKSREIDEINYPFIKKLTDEEYTTFRDVIRKTLQTSQEREREIVEEIISDIEQTKFMNENEETSLSASEVNKLLETLIDLARKTAKFHNP